MAADKKTECDPQLLWQAAWTIVLDPIWQDDFDPILQQICVESSPYFDFQYVVATS
jgi:hypothetical protein